MKRLRFIASLAGFLAYSFLSPLPALAISTDDLHSVVYDTVWFDTRTGQTCNSLGSDASNLVGATNVEKAMNYFMSKGLSKEAAAGVVGNLEAESGVEPERLQYTASGTQTPVDSLGSNLTDPNVGWGIAQWTPPNKMVDPLKAAGKDPNLLVNQLDFLWGDMQGRSQLMAALKSATSPESSADAFVTMYEIPADIPTQEAIREVLARNTYNSFSGTGPVAPGASAAPINNDNCQTAPGSKDISAYKDPFRSVQGLVMQRIDQGVDAIGTGPVYPLGNATLVDDLPSGWCGGCTSPDAFLVYQLSDGPAAGKYVYQAEACVLRPQYSLNPPNNKLSVDQPLCDMNPTSIEIGWAQPPGNGHYALAHAEYQAAPSCAGNGFATSYGQNFSKLLAHWGHPGVLQAGCGVSSTPLPAGWPQW